MTRDEDPQFDSLPPAIVDALRELDEQPLLPDAERDAAVLSGARRHLGQAHPASRKRRNLRLFFAGSAGGAIAAAAVIAITVFIINPSDDQAADREMNMALRNSEPAMADSPLLGDVNGSGTVDILDAYALARRIDRGQAADTFDVNNDGEITQADVDWIATQAVTLRTGERI